MTPTHLIGSVYAAEVPDNAYGFEFDNPLQEGDLVYYLDYPSVYNFRWLSVPEGNWEIICTTKECTEEQAKGIVEREEGEFKDYECDDAVYLYAANSLRSLLTSKGLDNNKNYVLIKKIA